MFPFPDFFGGGQTFCNEIQFKTKDVMMRMEGIPVYLLKAYADLTSYDIILDARNGNIIKRTERCL